MKVDFQTYGANQNVDVEKEKIAKSTATPARKADHESGYKVDISGTVMDNAAYKTEDLKSAEEVMQDAGRTDVALQRDYMAVMSNSMSTEDFAKLQEEGYPPGSTTVETSVTILDEIKATLAKSGVDVEGYTDDISDEQLEEITGSISGAELIEQKLRENDLPVTDEQVEKIEQVVSQVENITGMSDGMIKYMLSNGMEPTIDHVYKAEYSSTGTGTARQSKGYYTDDTGYYAKKADRIDWEQLDSQINKIIENAGLEINDETKANSRWLIEQGIPLTEDTIRELGELRSIDFPLTREALIDSVVAAIANGKEAKQAVLTETESAAKQAVKILEQTQSISSEAVKAVTEQGKEVTIEALYEAEQELKQGSSGIKSAESPSQTYESIAAQRLLEETRLQMTVEANMKLIKSGYSIDTAPLEELVAKLKTAEQEYYSKLFGSENQTELSENISLYKRTTSVLLDIRSLPAAVLGKMSTEGATFTLSHVYSEGVTRKAAYDKAGESYEALGTAPRADMGDSLKKAFRNVDTLLSEMNMETNEINRRAVRILGYNQMEINEVSVQKVKEADQAVQRLLEKMTPAATLDMIREGRNPLSENIYELAEEIGETTAVQETEKYSEYLWKLEKNQEITAEERAAYIGIYRLFRQIEKSDGGVIGTVLQNEQPLTLKNLLSAARSSKAAGINVTIDQEFGVSEVLSGEEDSISAQIEGYYQSLSREVLEKLTPDKLQKMSYGMDTSIEAFTEELRSAEEDQEMQQAYVKNQLQEINEAYRAEDYVISELLQYDQQITPDHIAAKAALMNQRGSVFKQVLEQADQTEDSAQKGNRLKEAFIQDTEKLQDCMGDEESAKAAYEAMAETAEQILTEQADAQIYAVDVREMNLLHKQLSVAANLAREGNYEIPIQLNGEMTSINLRIIRDTGQKGRVAVTMQTNEYGKVAAEFRVGSGQVEGYIGSDSKEGLQLLSDMEQSLRETLRTESQEVKELHFIYSSQLDINQFGQNRNQESNHSEKDLMTAETGTKELYETAKAFIISLKSIQS